MPELPEVETVRRGLAQAMAGQRIVGLEVRRDGLRFPFPADFRQRLQGATLERFERRAKYILAYTDRRDALLIHLGMSGRFTILPPTGPAEGPATFYYNQAQAQGSGAHDHVVFDLEDGTRVIYSDPRRFGLMDITPAEQAREHRLLRGIGVEPLGDDFTPSYLAERFRDKKAPLKAALLDQRIVAGLGNIYVCEALFRSGLSPERAAGSIVRSKGASPQVRALVANIRTVLEDAIAAGGSTLRDYVQVNGELGYFQHQFDVYDREGKPCPRPGCKGAVERIVQSGRSTFFCRTCQK
jgi:formamidopyrimidine-DNA glycosylase